MFPSKIGTGHSANERKHTTWVTWHRSLQHGVALERFQPQYRAGECGKDEARAMTARNGRSIARGRSRVRRERDKDEICAEAGSVARPSPTPRTRRARYRGVLRARPNGLVVPRILARLTGVRAHSYRAVCEVREVAGAAGSNPTYPPVPSPGQVPTGRGHGQRRGRLRCATPRPRSRSGPLKKVRFRLVLSCGRSKLLRDGRRRRFSSSTLSRSVTSSERAHTRRDATSRVGQGRPRPRP